MNLQIRRDKTFKATSLNHLKEGSILATMEESSVLDVFNVEACFFQLLKADWPVNIMIYLLKLLRARYRKSPDFFS